MPSSKRTRSRRRRSSVGLGLLLSSCVIPGPDAPATPILTIEGTVRTLEVCPRCLNPQICEALDPLPEPCWEDAPEPLPPSSTRTLQWVWLVRGQLERPFTLGAETTTVDRDGRYRLEVRQPPPAEALFQDAPRGGGTPPSTVAFGFVSQADEDREDRLHALARLRPFALVPGARALEDPPLPSGWSAARLEDDDVSTELEPLPRSTVVMDVVWLTEGAPIPLRSCASVQRIRTIETVSTEVAGARIRDVGAEEWYCFDEEASLAGYWACPDYAGLLCTPSCEVDILDLAPGASPPPEWPCRGEDS